MSYEEDTPGGAPPQVTKTLQADTSELYRAGHLWEWDVSLSLAGAQAQVAAGEGGGYLFGAALATPGEQHDVFVSMVSQLLSDGSRNATAIGAAIRRTCDDYVTTDLHTSAELQQQGRP